MSPEDASGQKFGARLVEVDVVLKEVADVSRRAVVVREALATKLGVADLAVLAVIGDHAKPAFVKPLPDVVGASVAVWDGRDDNHGAMFSLVDGVDELMEHVFKVSQCIGVLDLAKVVAADADDQAEWG